MKTALITGASSGIGKELAYIHAENGGDLVLVARSGDKLETIKKDIEEKYKVKVDIIVKDLSIPNSPFEVYNEIKQKNIDIEYLINNAGFGGIGYFHKRDLSKDLAMINVNIVALTTLTHLFLQDFTKKNSGKILNVSSTASLLPGPLQAVYYATKAFVTSFSNAISEELKNTNITVTNLMPGATNTGFGKVSGMDKTVLFNKTASARQVALAGYNGMLKGKRDIISGITFSQKIMFALLPFTPKKLKLFSVFKMQQEVK
ncbi:MAG: isfD [Fusobacteriales bacterium]|jgi:short-subunit dehydrogenase|nr:isfD [Fusobacteriales bacterium]